MKSEIPKYNVNDRPGAIYFASFKNKRTTVSFRFEMSKNLYDYKNDILSGCEACKECVSDAILEAILSENEFIQFLPTNHDFNFFYDSESGTVKMLNESEKTLNILTISDFTKIHTVRYEDI